MFGESAGRLAGFAGVMFGWTPDTFWKATPAELQALVRTVAGDAPSPLASADWVRLKEMFPDG
jgi:hypothetical protein